MFGKLAGQLADAVSDIGDGVAIRQRGSRSSEAEEKCRALWPRLIITLRRPR
jgi:hypothetical protein